MEFIGENREKQTVIVLGSGPIRIGQGIEFDYASVHCVMSLRQLGYEVVIINNNPETVSTDFDTGDRLYFEPLSPEDVLDIIKIEKPIGVVVAFGGQTAIKLTKTLAAHNIPILGSSADTIDMAEDRERFDELLERSGIKRPKGHTIMTTEEALNAARDLGYPVLMRPSYVLGGQNMIIAYCDEDIEEYMAIILSHKQDNPVLIDKYLSGMEIEVDAICDGENILIPGIMEHVERTGIHLRRQHRRVPRLGHRRRHERQDRGHHRDPLPGAQRPGAHQLAVHPHGWGDLRHRGEPSASRTVPYISKVTGVPMCDLATKVSLGYKLVDLGFGTGLYKPSPYVAVKVPVFSFEKLTDVDTHLGPEMKSTGEVLGIGNNLEEALYKGLIASGHKMTKGGGVFITVRDQDKPEIGEIAKKFDKMGFAIYATTGTAMVRGQGGPLREDCGQDPRELRQHHHLAGKRQGKLRHLHLRQGPQPRPGQREDPPQGKPAGHPLPDGFGHRQRPGRLPDEPLHPGEHGDYRHQQLEGAQAEAEVHQDVRLLQRLYLYQPL